MDITKQLNILYIEDDPNIAEIYTMMIKELFENVEVEWFYDCIKAKQEIKNNPTKYDLIISDFKIPNGSGAEIFQLVNGQMLGIPFIILSGFDCSNNPEFAGFFNSHVHNAVLVKPASIDDLKEKIQWCLQSETDILKIYNKSIISSDEKVPIGSDVFLRLNTIPCNVYLKLSDGKFVKVINKFEMFEKSLIQKLILKGINHFYVNRSELSQYSDTVISTLTTSIKMKKSKGDEIQKSQLNNTALGLLKKNLLKCGISETLIRASDEVISLQLDLIRSSKELNEFVEKFQLFKRAASEHTRIVNYIIFSILKDLTWDSESTIHKMSFAALLHDISLPAIFYGQQFETKEQIEKLSEEDKNIYKKHPEESAHISTNFDSITGGVDRFIREHHELPNGKGFPRRLNYNTIHPLSAVLHLADFIASLMWEHNFNMEIVIQKIRENRAFYQRGFYRKPFEAVCRIFNVPNK